MKFLVACDIFWLRYYEATADVMTKFAVISLVAIVLINLALPVEALSSCGSCPGDRTPAGVEEPSRVITPPPDGTRERIDRNLDEVLDLLRPLEEVYERKVMEDILRLIRLTCEAIEKERNRMTITGDTASMQFWASRPEGEFDAYMRKQTEMLRNREENIARHRRELRDYRKEFKNICKKAFGWDKGK